MTKHTPNNEAETVEPMEEFYNPSMEPVIMTFMNELVAKMNELIEAHNALVRKRTK